MTLRATAHVGVWAAVTLGIAVACGPASKEDNFTSQIAPRCATAGGCDEALKDAKARVAHCEAETPGNCTWVREDLASVERLNKRHVEESAARVARANEAKPAEPKPSAAVEAARGGIPLSEHAAALRTALADCKATAKFSRCADEGASAEEKVACDFECTKFGKQRSEDLFQGQLRACAEIAVLDPKGVAKCAADGRVWAPKERLDECSKKCAVLGGKLRAYNAAHTKCCDGTRSPTCTNGAPGADCCAANQGVCQEPKPTE